MATATKKKNVGNISDDAVRDLRNAVDKLYEFKEHDGIDTLTGEIEGDLTFVEEVFEQQSDKITELEENVRELENQIEEMPTDEELSVQVHTGLGYINYKTESLLDAELMEAFTECIVTVNPVELLQHLQEVAKTKILL